MAKVVIILEDDNTNIKIVEETRQGGFFGPGRTATGDLPAVLAKATGRAFGALQSEVQAFSPIVKMAADLANLLETSKTPESAPDTDNSDAAKAAKEFVEAKTAEVRAKVKDLPPRGDGDKVDAVSNR